METTKIAISQKAMLVIALITNAVSNSITGVSFVRMKNYRNQLGELSDVTINVGISYANAVKKDIEFLTNINLSEYVWNSPIALIEEARKTLIEAFINPNENRSKGQTDAYSIIFDGVKVHNETGLLYVYGTKVGEKVIKEQGEKKVVKSAPITIAKDELRKLLKTNKYRQYAVEVGNTISANGESLEL
jgi:hypothetical protein